VQPHPCRCTANSLPSGLSYFGALARLGRAVRGASDSHASIIQRPRIQTSQAKPAQFFVGDTVPYVTSTYNYAAPTATSFLLPVVRRRGTGCDTVINPDGLVVMQIQQEIDDLNGYTTITGVGQIQTPLSARSILKLPSGTRTPSCRGFIKNAKSTSRSGVRYCRTYRSRALFPSATVRRRARSSSS